MIILRDTISGVPMEVDEATAKRYLSHPVWSKRLEPARVAKPEILSQPSVIEDGEKKPLDKVETEKTPAKEESK